MTSPVYTRVLIIGTGFSGIGMAIALNKAGIHDYVILEKADTFGGTWRDNVYPGIACDVPAHLYSFSFEPKPDWTKLWASGGEIQEYLLDIAAKHRLAEHAVFGAKVVEADWSDTECRWHVHIEDGREFIAQFVVSGVGALHIPQIPDIPFRDSFRGKQFHTAEWDTEIDLQGRHVAVVGTGASAIQVVPAILDEVESLTLFQRTPAWVVARPDFTIPGWLQFGFKWVPGLRLATRFGIHLWQEFIGEGMTKHLGLLNIIEWLGKRNLRNIRDPKLREKLTPKYKAGCKRVGFAVGFYQALDDPKSTVVTDPIVGATEAGLVTRRADGSSVMYEVDTIIWATGFHVTDSYRYLGHIRGTGGTDLVEQWDKTGMIAHRGITVENMPNLFFLLGPNTGLGHNSVVIMIEAQIKYVIQAIQSVDVFGADALMPKPAAIAAYNEWVQKRLGRTVQNIGGCMSWYLDEHGNNRVLWPGHTGEYRRAVRWLEPSEYEYIRAI